MLGLEHEFVLRTPGGAVIDARDVLARRERDRRRLDPGDRNAIRCAWGGAITCDGAEAEIAIAPVEIAAGFTRIADAAGLTATDELRALLPAATTIDGFSTHINVEVPSRMAVRVGWLFARRFAPAAMLAMDRATSPGLLVRPRPGRLEICGESMQGPQLRAATALVAGAVRACVAGASTDDGIAARLPPIVPFRPWRATERFGWYIPRRAFGFDLYAGGRAAVLGELTAQRFLETAWSLARDFVPDHDEADALVSGAMPLPLEELLPADAVPAHAPSPYGRALVPITRGRFQMTAYLQTWDLTVLEVRAPQRSFYLSIPARDLDAVLHGIDAGRWDAALAVFAGRRVRPRRLEHWTQTGTVALFDDVGDRRALLRPERDLDGDIVDVWAHRSPRRGVARAHADAPREPVSGSTAQHPGAAAPRGTATGQRERPDTEQRPGKYPPPFTEPPPVEPPATEPPPPGGSSWWPWPIAPIIVVTVIVITVVSILTGGGTGVIGPSASPSISPSTSTGPAACVEPFMEIARDLALECPLTEHTDATGDGTWYEAAVPADPLPPDSDLIGVQASMARLSSSVVQRFFGNTDYPCGRSPTRLVVCGGKALRAGPALVVAMRFAAPVPLDGEHFRIISVMLDGSPPVGGFRGNPGADQDLYLGTDVTFDLVYSPIGTRPKSWVLGGTNPLKIGTDANVVETGSVAVIEGDTIVYFIPGREFRSPRPRLRAVAQVADISFGPQRGFASADVAPGRPADAPSAMFPVDLARRLRTKPSAIAAPETVESFLALLTDAMRRGDAATLVTRLHPAVRQRYDIADCRRLHAEADPTRAFVVRGVTTEPYDWTSDDRTTRIDPALTVEVDRTVGGVTTRTVIHLARVGSTLRFFSDCGAPR